ncbi:hypothetical protein PR048_028373 [Dryococelus australis]|uniref:Uncharacterized protein n=1 Tax=Dryococelus australis TaxID=614101 RepID=A0ABQ9GJ47_9NEOP|nr:hypothetical protein PR048_028373 [Dryococelus australis]
MNVPVVTDGCPHKLRCLVDVLKENLGALKVLKFPMDQWCFVMLNIFLKFRCKALISYSTTRKVGPVTTINSRKSFFASSERVCIVCNQGHDIYKCPVFLGHTLLERRDMWCTNTVRVSNA